jgi:hypothetical protein
MGHYYEFKTKEIRLKKDTPEHIINFLQKILISKDWHDTEPPEKHDLFDLPRWEVLFSKSAFHEDGPYFKKVGDYWRLYLHCEINYGYRECEEFANWIGPYVAGHKPKEWIGWYKGEDSRQFRNDLYIKK